MNMDWTTKLSKKEWSIFLRNDVQLPAIAHGEIEYLAGKLARRSQTIGDFTQLTEQQLVMLMFYRLRCFQYVHF